ncbi:MAG: cell division protein FtsZ, partial [Luteolibacter sp.]
MTSHARAKRAIIDPASVKIIGIGGAGASFLEQLALDGLDSAGLLLLSADARVLGACVAPEKIQLGEKLLKGLGAGGDSELGKNAVLEVESSLRRSLEGQKVVIICVGLGGGTGSGAAPIVARIARESGAMVAVIVTTPFAFEGKRRSEQADEALSQLSAHANALITFDNNRMGETVLAKQGAHDAFAATDQLIGESIRAITRIVTRPGLIHLGLDDLISALGDAGSPCIFGSGLAEGKDRSSTALRRALASPLLGQDSSLKEAQTVLVYACGGEDLTLMEIEIVMQGVQKVLHEDVHLIFGAAIDPSLGSSLTVTLLSSLPNGAATRLAPKASVVVAPPTPTPTKTEEPEMAMPAELEPAPAPPEPTMPEASPVESDLFSEDQQPLALFARPDKSEFSGENSADEQAQEAPSDPVPTKSRKKSTDQAAHAQRVKLSVKAAGTQSELSLDSVPRGR